MSTTSTGLVDKLYNLKWITAKDADDAKEYFKFIIAVQNEHKDAFLTLMKIKFVWIRSFVILCMVTPSSENAGIPLSSYLLYLTDRLL